MEETRRAIEDIEEKEVITLEDIDRLTKLVDGAYTKAETIKEYEEGWKIGWEAKQVVLDHGFDRTIQAQVHYSGLFSGYYNLLKRLEASEEISEKEINGLIEETEDLFYGIDKLIDIRGWIKYSYLLSVEHSQLKVMCALARAKKFDETVVTESKATGDIAGVLKGINSSGLTAEKAGDYERAIEIFSKAEKDFSEAIEMPGALQEYANCINNRGNNRAKLSDREPSRYSKINLLFLAVADFRRAENLYLRVIPEPPRKHISGIVNRVINASYRLILLEAGDSFDRTGKRIKRASTEEKDREKAISAGKRIKRAFTEEKDREKAIKIIREVYAEWRPLEATHSEILETIQKAEEFLKRAN